MTICLFLLHLDGFRSVDPTSNLPNQGPHGPALPPPPIPPYLSLSSSLFKPSTTTAIKLLTNHLRSEHSLFLSFSHEGLWLAIHLSLSLSLPHRWSFYSTQWPHLMADPPPHDLRDSLLCLLLSFFFFFFFATPLGRALCLLSLSLHLLDQPNTPPLSFSFSVCSWFSVNAC